LLTFTGNHKNTVALNKLIVNYDKYQQSGALLIKDFRLHHPLKPISPIHLTKPLTFAKMLIVQATWPSGKARVCKTLIMGSNPIVASFFI
jgi:hypothetical protein